MERRILISFLISGFIVGVFLVLQLKTEVYVPSNFAIDEVEARQKLIKELLDEQSFLQSRIVKLRGQIESEQSDLEEQSENFNFNKLDSLKKEVGLISVSGPGLEIILDDSPLSDREEADEELEANLVQASDIRDVINILNATRAEAISINNQRVIANSTITSVGTTILVNNSHLSPPFIINAVGDTNLMISKLEDRSSMVNLYSKVENSRLIFRIIPHDIINIPVYNGDLKTDQLNLIEQ